MRRAGRLPRRPACDRPPGPAERAAGGEARRGGRAVLLGIDIGGTKVALALGERDGAPRAHRRLATRPSGEGRADLERIVQAARALLEEAGVPLAAVERVGVSLPGPLDLAAGRVLDLPNLPGWEGLPVRDLLGEAFGRPVELENDANAAALAEWRYGAGRGAQHLVYLTMSTGVGAGLVLGGRLHRGVAGSAGEVGHMPLVQDGEPCACGLRGCVEAYLGGAAWARRLARTTPPASRAAALAGGPAAVTPEHLVEAAREGDAFALEELRRWNHLLARTLTMLTFVLAPERFVLGTIARAAGEALCLDPVREEVRAHVWPILGGGLRIEAAELGEELPYRAGLAVAIASREGLLG